VLPSGWRRMDHWERESGPEIRKIHHIITRIKGAITRVTDCAQRMSDSCHRKGGSRGISTCREKGRGIGVESNAFYYLAEKERRKKGKKSVASTGRKREDQNRIRKEGCVYRGRRGNLRNEKKVKRGGLDADPARVCAQALHQGKVASYRRGRGVRILLDHPFSPEREENWELTGKGSDLRLICTGEKKETDSGGGWGPKLHLL